MTTYCGVDFHARQQTVYYRDTADGVITENCTMRGVTFVRLYFQPSGEAVVG